MDDKALNVLRLALVLALLSACGGSAGRPPAVNAKPNDVDFDTEATIALPDVDADAPLYRDAAYDPSVTTPAQCLGYPLGARMAPHAAIVDCFRGWAESSDRARFEVYGQTHEGRDLVRVVISSPENLARLDEILANVGKLANPRGLSAGDIERIANDTPAVGWFGYSIHGDETSGADASLAFGHYLIAGTDDRAKSILDETVVVIDPAMNPDGRTRFLAMVEQTRSRVNSLNHDSLHRGYWPRGRGNHYLFDLNRDWLTGSQPETRARWANFRKFNPQLFVDVHEMGPLDTFLFSPKGVPTNPNYARTAARWNKQFADDQGEAFDAYGWSYYTREWSDNWYPGYSSTWGPLQGAVGILHEQARLAGQAVRRRTGEVATYRDAVHHQAVGSLANAVTLARNRRDVLRDFAAYHKDSLAAAGGPRTFVLVPGRAPDRERALVAALLGQGIEVFAAGAAFSGRNVESTLRTTEASKAFAAGAYLVDAAQPKGALALALLELDPRIAKKDLDEERQDLERTGRGGIYDVTSWNLGMAYGVESYWIDTPRVVRTAVTAAPVAPAGVVAASGDAPPVAWAVSSADDASVAFAARALERGVQVFASDRSFDAVGRQFPRGSLLVRRIENQADVGAVLAEVAAEVGVEVFALPTGRSATDGPDLGGQHFELLAKPRVGLLANTPVSPSDYGHIWHQLDRELGVPVTLLDVQQLGSYDLRRYNVIVVPPLWSGASALAPHASALRTWVKSGGTLVASGAGAVVIADPALGLTRVRRRRDVLADLPLFDAATRRWLDSQSVDVDPADIWDRPGLPAASPAEAALAKTAEPREGEAAAAARAREDRWLRRFSPSGAFLHGLLDDDHWLTAGLGGFGDSGTAVPVLAQGDLALLAPESVRVPVRLAEAETLRLSGLLWPEARARLATTAWATVDRSGFGQVILFAGRPGFRAQQRATARLLSNAVVFGPGLGARQPVEW